MSIFLNMEDVLYFHSVLIRRYGGLDGIRDNGALEAAVFRPQNGYYSGPVEEACALTESLLINHPFVDGNKRTAFAACDVFLRINGLQLSPSDREIYRAIIRWLETPAGERFACMKHDIEQMIK